MLERGLWGKRFTWMRWSRHLNRLKNLSNMSNDQFANVLGMDDARLRDWMTARPKRGPKATTAFELGNVMRIGGGLPTSGMECLYAYGFWTELFELLKHLSVDRAHDGLRIAVQAYCVLPDIEFERLVLDDAMAQLPPGQSEYVKANHVRDLALFGSDAAGNRYIDPCDWKEERARTLELLREPATIAVIESAWHHVLHNRTQPTGEERVDEESLAIIEAVITLSKNETMREAPPTIVAVRLWRMLAEWAHAIDPQNYVSGYLPDVFATFEEVERRGADEANYIEELAYSAEADSYRGK